MPDALESQIRECFGRVVYSHKAHEKQADILAERLRCIKIWQITFSAVTTVGIVGTLLSIFLEENSPWPAAIAAFFSTIQLGLSLYTKEQELGESSEAHSKTADQLWDVRESYLSLLTDIQSGSLEDEAIREKRDELQSMLSGIYESAPRTSDRAYSRAQEALKLNEDLTFSAREIDQFLPSPLRKTDNPQ